MMRRPKVCEPTAARSENMRRIRSTNTKPELLLRRALHREGIRYRLHVSNLPGRPDILFPSSKLVIMVHGCFWHQHGDCAEASRPKSNTAYWRPKLAANVARDQKHKKALRRLGYRTVTLWECDIERNLNRAVMRVRRMLRA